VRLRRVPSSHQPAAFDAEKGGGKRKKKAQPEKEKKNRNFRRLYNAELSSRQVGRERRGEKRKKRRPGGKGW